MRLLGGLCDAAADGAPVRAVVRDATSVRRPGGRIVRPLAEVRVFREEDSAPELRGVP
ncbi:MULTISPECIES: hypothetical protein [Streptomyces]|uniref:hypothetical protein n=1 Tax=Streptomyces TaxID=1883 RepID=UPI000A43A412|nr:hypothetical protein [Streptomyces durhamensis]